MGIFITSCALLNGTAKNNKVRNKSSKTYCTQHEKKTIYEKSSSQFFKQTKAEPDCRLTRSKV